MQKGQRIWKDCENCSGTGKMYNRSNYAYDEPEPPDLGNYEEVVCSTCNGLGINPWGWVRDKPEETMPGDGD